MQALTHHLYPGCWLHHPTAVQSQEDNTCKGVVRTHILYLIPNISPVHITPLWPLLSSLISASPHLSLPFLTLP